MTMLEQLRTDLVASIKKGDANRVETLRFLIAAIKNVAIAKYGNTAETSLTDADCLDSIKKQVKTHKESIEAFKKAGRNDLVTKEQNQLTILETFLPKQLSDEELKALLAPVVASGETNFGLLMKQAMAATHGQADGGRVAGLLKQLTAK